MVQSDEGKQGTAAFLASLMHLVAVPRPGEGRTEMQHPARKRLAGEDVHPEMKMHQRTLGEGEIGRWCRVLEQQNRYLCQQNPREGSQPVGEVRPRRKR